MDLTIAHQELERRITQRIMGWTACHFLGDTLVRGQFRVLSGACSHFRSAPGKAGKKDKEVRVLWVPINRAG